MQHSIAVICGPPYSTIVFYNPLWINQFRAKGNKSETRRFELVYPLCAVEYNSSTSQDEYLMMNTRWCHLYTKAGRVERNLKTPVIGQCELPVRQQRISAVDEFAKFRPVGCNYQYEGTIVAS